MCVNSILQLIFTALVLPLFGSAHSNSILSSTLTSNSSVSLATSSSWERVITDLKVIHSKDGVHLNFLYNETNNEADDGTVPSAPGCPRSVEGYPWVHYGNPPTKCFLVGSRGPCPSGQLFFGNASTNSGFCDCVCPEPVIKLRLIDSKREIAIGLNADDGPLTKENGNLRFCNFKDSHEINEAVFDKTNSNCYFLETQGFCQVGEWLIKDETGFGLKCISECSAEHGPLSKFKFDYKSQKCASKEYQGSSQPISLAGSIGQRACDDNKVYSKMLNKCIPKSKAFMLRF